MGLLKCVVISWNKKAMAEISLNQANSLSLFRVCSKCSSLAMYKDIILRHKEMVVLLTT